MPGEPAVGVVGMAGALGLGMHAVFFGLKRAHHGVLSITRDKLAALGLTPARFDLLYAVKLYRRRGVTQRRLRQVLGVCGATVSRMLKSLEDLGCVTRTIDPRDRRRKLVKLAPPGRKRVTRAIYYFRRSGWAKLAVESALGGGSLKYHWYNPEDCLEATGLADSFLKAFRTTYGDVATLHYPWAPDEKFMNMEAEDGFEAIEEREETYPSPPGWTDEWPDPSN